MKIKTIIFDYGGTLDTDAVHWAHVLWAGYRKAEVPVSEQQFRDAYVFGERALAKAPIVEADDTFRRVLEKKVNQEFLALEAAALWTPGAEERAAALATIVDYCDTYARRQTLTSRNVVARLAEKYRLVLVSNFYGNIHAILSDYGLAPFFPDVIESAVVGVRKPDPAIYRLGVEAAGCAPEECVVVGDSFGKDIVPAKAVGARAIWMKGPGWNSDETADADLPDVVIRHITELPDALVALGD